MKRPPALRIDLNDRETVSAYDELPLWSAMFGILLLKHLPLRRHATVLDVGCGTGFPLLELAERLGSTCRVHGIDPWAAALQRARRKAQVRQVRNVSLWQGDAAAMPFPDGQFDLVVSNLGINNFSDPEAVLRECRRVSGQTARLVLTTNLQGHMEEFYAVFESTLFEMGLPNAITALQAHIRHRATVEGLAALFERAGFRLSEVREEKESMRFLDGSALLQHYFIRLGFLDGWTGVLPAEEQEQALSRLEANLNALSESRGELALTIPMAYVEAVRMEDSRVES
jgi:ubiquinone/menaquinone biosynthesis C-methylase UbiE